VNTRLQVEHGVTEQVTGVDLVEWMVRLAPATAAAGELRAPPARPSRCVSTPKTRRELPALPGLLTEVAFPRPMRRIDTWVEAGSEVPPYYDPMLAKLIVTADDRASDAAGQAAGGAGRHPPGRHRDQPRYLRQIGRRRFAQGRRPRACWNACTTARHRRGAGTRHLQTTVQDWPGRTGYWDVGVPPSGPMDDLACAWPTAGGQRRRRRRRWNHR
jgi:urea carboxylase